MKLEHVALNVPDVRTVVAWYVEHLGFSVHRTEAVAPYKTFLGDGAGAVMVEFYSSPELGIPDYTRQDPAVVHLGFLVPDAEAERVRLEGAGARFVSKANPRVGTVLIMMRDPWGIPLQLCERN